MKHSSIDAAADFHAAWCSCDRCNYGAPGQKPELRALAFGLVAGLVVVALLFVGVL